MPSLRWCLLPLLMLAACSDSPPAPRVLLVTVDGLRWQEVFRGADARLIRDPRYVRDTTALVERFWRPTPEARRRALMPFFWDVVARDGQLYGHRSEGSRVDVTNRHRFSYPGYNEILTGFADDDRIDSNDKVDNPNVTVLEVVNGQAEFAGRVAAFGSWDVFPYILNERRSGLPVNAGFRTAPGPSLTDRERFLNELQPEVPSPWATVRLDAFTHHYAFEYLKTRRPRLLYIAYGETDDFAHDGRYDAYLDAAHRTDAFLAALWAWVQATPGYRDATTLLVTTDHGRGAGDAWTDHGAGVPGAEAIWLAALGPHTPARGEVRGGPPLAQNQVAATVAALLGVPYAPDRPHGAPVPGILGR